MSSITGIQHLEPSRVAHELISKPYGTFIVRASTTNDDILSEIRIESETNTESLPYVVLSVRVRESQYKSPIMNYRLSHNGLNGQDDLLQLLKQYKKNRKKSSVYKLPELQNEFIVLSPDTDWKIDGNFIQTAYTNVFSPVGYNAIEPETICNFLNGTTEVAVFEKPFQNNSECFEREFSIIKNLCFFHITSFYGIHSILNVTNLVFAHHGLSLKSLCPLTDNTDMSVSKQLANIGYQIACGMIYLECKKIIHRDLHAGNILMDKYGYIRIADFGHAIIKDEDNDKFQQTLKKSEKKFQIRRLAPECLPSPPESGKLNSYDELCCAFSSKSDVWAFGLILIELLMESHSDVYPDLIKKDGGQEIIQYVKVDRKIHEEPYDYPEQMYCILTKCWTYDPEKRISFMNIRNEMRHISESTDD